MAKKRISTTISRIHWNILKNKTEELGSQQKVLEKALELIDREDFNDTSEVDRVVRIRQDLCKRPYFMLFHRQGFGRIIDGDKEIFKKEKFIENSLNNFFDRDLERLSKAEKIKLLIDYYKIQSTFEYIDYSKNEDHISIDFHHHEGIRYSEFFAFLNDNYFKDNEINVNTRIGNYFIRHKIINY